MRLEALLGFVLVPWLAVGACGGSTGSGGSTGTGASGGSGGTGTGGTNTGGTGTGGTGTGGCAGGGGIDCVDYCTGQMYSPSCVNGSWKCGPVTPCADAAACASDQVPTVDGCLSCTDATTAFTAAIEAARKANASCTDVTDCTLVSSSTTCQGACQVAIASSSAAAFQAALLGVDQDYCSGFVAVCGYATPKCAVATLTCNAGSCEAVYN